MLPNGIMSVSDFAALAQHRRAGATSWDSPGSSSPVVGARRSSIPSPSPGREGGGPTLRAGEPAFPTRFVPEWVSSGPGRGISDIVPAHGTTSPASPDGVTKSAAGRAVDAEA